MNALKAQTGTYENSSLIERLPPVRGRYSENAPLGNLTWFQVGGPAEVLFKPADQEDLAKFLAGCPEDVPISIMGVASNLIIRDGGIPGVTIRLGRDFAAIETEGTEVYAGAAALDMNVALTCARAGIGGLEFFSGIPGTIGGALRMNAGSYGTETIDVLIEAEAVDREGVLRCLKPGIDMNLTYRNNDIPENFIFTGARFRGCAEDPETIERRMNEIKERRAASQPIKSKTGGSTFANPLPEQLAGTAFEGKKAWQLIDAAGCRGLTIGGAQMSEKHCNFMINIGGATAENLETLGETVRKRVFDMAGIWLRWEIRRIGVPLEGSLGYSTPTAGAA